jgi:hypothetical protein
LFKSGLVVLRVGVVLFLFVVSALFYVHHFLHSGAAWLPSCWWPACLALALWAVAFISFGGVEKTLAFKTLFPALVLVVRLGWSGDGTACKGFLNVHEVCCLGL